MKRNVVHAATLLPLAIGLATMPVGDALRSTARSSHHVASGAAEGAEFPLACTLPFDSIKQVHPIDDACGAAGSAQADTAPEQAAQNEAKNSFCQTGAPAGLGFDHFDSLQSAAEAAHIPFGSSSHLPPDRSLLRSLISLPANGVVGEGNVVRLSAYVIDAHYSNVSSGESVNCQTAGQEFNDIHIVLGQTPDDDPCRSVTAEMSPHFRPDMWTPDVLDKLAGRPLRFTGQLFFDASHKPCSNGHRSSPPRRSLFEIHPVYAVDVCRAVVPSSDKAAWLQQCESASDDNWVSLQAWVGDESNTAGEE